MITHNPANVRIKRRYFAYLKEARQCSEASLDMVAKALNRFETYTRFRDFRTFRTEQAVAFKRHLSDQVGSKTGDKLSKATLHSTLNALRNFFIWVAGQPGFRSRLNYSDGDYFHLSAKETAIAKAHRDALVPTIDQIMHVLRIMPDDSDIKRRDRAIIAFTLLTGIRDRALVSLSLKHIHIDRSCVVQDARDVQTKFSKTCTVYFFPVEPEVASIVEEWVRYLATKKLWSLDDPLFPATRVALDADHQFEAVGLDRKHWTTAGSIRKIFKEAFEAAGLSYFPPHSFRKTLARYGEQLCRTPEEFKAWSQNLSHEKVLTTFASYGEVSLMRQAEIIRRLGTPVLHDTAALEQIAQVLRSTGRSGQLVGG
jgi:integrase